MKFTSHSIQHVIGFMRCQSCLSGKPNKTKTIVEGKSGINQIHLMCDKDTHVIEFLSSEIKSESLWRY